MPMVMHADHSGDGHMSRRWAVGVVRVSSGVSWGGPPATARSTRSLGGFSELWSASEVRAPPPPQPESRH